MTLTNQQLGTLKGMAVGLLAALCIIAVGSWLNPFAYSEPVEALDRLSLAIMACIIPMAFLSLAIARLAKHRFFSTRDIDASTEQTQTVRAGILQSLVQNTAEQTLLAALVYCAWSLLMPANYLSVFPMASLAFGVGRVLFFVGYENGASSRAIGFTLSFYPSVLMLAGLIFFLLAQQIN